LLPALPTSLASIKLANPGSPGKMAVKMERKERGVSFSFYEGLKVKNKP